DYVACGRDQSFTYQKLAEAHLCVQGGAQFIATNRDATFPDSGGRTLPGAGSLVAALATSTGIEPITIGKPETYTVELILRLAAMKASECVVVGDRLDTDIAVGNRVGAKTVMVLTGVHTRADAESAPPEHRP